VLLLVAQTFCKAESSDVSHGDINIIPTGMVDGDAVRDGAEVGGSTTLVTIVVLSFGLLKIFFIVKS
jgi:hypothetical protein